MTVFTGCSLKNAAENDFKPRSKIKPLFDSETLAQRYGDGEKLKVKIIIPLTEDTIGYYDVQNILELPVLDDRQRNFVETISDKFKLTLYQSAITFGLSSKVKFSSSLDLFSFDPEYFEAVNIKKVYFTVEECDSENQDCNNKGREHQNIEFVDSMFVNAKFLKKYEEVEQVSVLGDGDFESEARKVFIDEDERREVSKDSATIIKYKNYSKLIDQKNVLLRKGYIKIFEDIIGSRRDIKKFLSQKAFEKDIKVIRDIRHGTKSKMRKGFMVRLHDHISSEMFWEKVKKELYPLANKVVVIRVKDKASIIKYKKLLKQEVHARYIEDVYIAGNSLFVDLKTEDTKQDFLKQLIQDRDFFSEEIAKVDSCQKMNCLSPQLTSENLVHYMTERSAIQFDFYMSLNSLNISDFKYNGFVELEITLKNIPF